MNRLTIIGNLTRDPELRTTAAGVQVCNFTVVVNRRRNQDGQQEADYFRVSAWDQLGLNCARYLTKGRKVAVFGPVSINTWQGTDGKTHSRLEIMATYVEFLTPRDETNDPSRDYVSGGSTGIRSEPNSEMIPVDMDNDLPF